jgi:hypothetical protein
VLPILTAPGLAVFSLAVPAQGTTLSPVPPVTGHLGGLMFSIMHSADEVVVRSLPASQFRAVQLIHGKKEGTTRVRSEEVTFDSSGCILAGTFTEAVNPVAAALLITGSGRTDRNTDAKVPGGRTLRIGAGRAIAGALAGAGVPSLRYDKRGVGASGGDYLRAGMDDQRADARAALGWLAARAGGLPLLAVGHSEGAWYAAELAADGAVDGAALLGAGARPAGQVLSWQTEMLAARLPAAARMILQITRTDVIRLQRKRVARIKASTAHIIRIQGIRLNARWWRDFLAHDPRPALGRITVPVLAITGGQDVQVPAEDVAAIGRLVQGPFEGHVARHLSHLLRPDPASAGPRAYRRAVRQPVDAEVLRLITTWITTHWGRPPAQSPEPPARADHA